MGDFVQRGMAIIMISSELPEIIGMSDRILVYHEGKINGEITRNELYQAENSQELIMRKAFGAK